MSYQASVPMDNIDCDDFRQMFRSSLEDLKYENANELGKIIGDKITLISTYRIIAEEIVSYGALEPKPNLIYFTKKLNHNRIFKEIEEVLFTRVKKALEEAEERDTSTRELENLGIIAGQLLTANVTQSTINNIINNSADKLIEGYHNNLGVVIIPFITNIATAYAKKPKMPNAPSVGTTEYFTLISILEEIRRRGIVPRHIDLRIAELLTIVNKNAGFIRISYNFDNPNINVIKRYKPCDKLMHERCAYGAACRYDHTFILKYLQSEEGHEYLDNNNGEEFALEYLIGSEKGCQFLMNFLKSERGLEFLRKYLI